MQSLSEAIRDIIWGPWLVALILGVGLYLSFRTGFVQITCFPKALRLFFSSLRESGAGDFRALCTALAATVGTGNLAGVAGAMALGGPGAVFWMWVCGLLGMVIKFAEATLSVRYRVRNASGEWVGGPMYMIRHALPRSFWPLASIYAFFGLIAAFGVGNATQINTLISSVWDTAATFGWSIPSRGKLFMGFGLALMIGAILLGGAAQIGRMAERLVPFAATMYLLLGILVLILRWQYILPAFSAIVTGAFAPRAVTGGLVGSVWITLRIGVSRGVFTNEAGMGTASMAHAGATVAHPVEQGLMEEECAQILKDFFRQLRLTLPNRKRWRKPGNE